MKNDDVTLQEMSEMGLFTVLGKLTGPAGTSEDVDLLVDTGSLHMILPKDIADRLELLPTFSLPVQVAGGRVEQWPIAEVRLALGDREMTVPTFITQAGRPILGCIALEYLYLTVDPVKKRLVSGELIQRGTIEGRPL